ncbi:MAG: molybdopterin cofactor-binding domain-containing protein [Kofleriaceae bacterium]
MPRVDGVAKVTGRARYLDDLDAPGAWHGVTVRSTIPHGTLDALELDPAFDWTDVVVGDRRRHPRRQRHPPHRGRPGRPGADRRDHPPRRRGPRSSPRRPGPAPSRRPGRSSRRPRRARRSCRWRRRCAPRCGCTATTTSSSSSSSARATPPTPSWRPPSPGRRIIEGEYRTSAQEQMYIEPQAMMAEWRDGRCYLVGSMQCLYYVHKAMKVLLGCGDDDVEITQSVTGGGFGGKEEYPSMLAAHVATVAKKAGRPVKIVHDRDEDIAATTKRHPSWTKHRLGLDADGAIVAIDADVVMDGGAYLTLSPVVLSRGVLHAAGPYKCPVTRVRGRVVATNHLPHGAFRGFGAPQTTFAYERQLDKAARALGVEPWPTAAPRRCAPATPPPPARC